MIFFYIALALGAWLVVSVLTGLASGKAIHIADERDGVDE